MNKYSAAIPPGSKSGWIALILLISSLSEGKVISREEALKLAFPGCQVESKILFMTETETSEAAKLAGIEISSPLIARYKAMQSGKVAGWAYLDTDIVRTKKQSLLIILDPDGKVRRVELVAFLEPPEYIPTDRWYEQFEGKQLSEGLQVQRDIHPVTGATLTTHATTKAVRRVLAIHQIMQKKEATK